MVKDDEVTYERNEQYVRTDLSQMKSFTTARNEKYRENFSTFYSTMAMSQSLTSNYSYVLTLRNRQRDENAGMIPVMNIIRSCIDTLVSKISQNKVRKFFNPVLGTWSTMKVCRAAQVFFDLYYDMQRVNKKSEEALYDALIFDMGVIWINDEDATVNTISPWEFVWDAAEMSNGTLTRCGFTRQEYPLTLLLKIIPKDSQWFHKLETTPNASCTYEIYYDLINKKAWDFIDGKLVRTRDIEYTRPPFVWMYFKTPVKGPWSDSVVDILFRLQKFYDGVVYKIGAAVNRSHAQTTFIPTGSDLEKSVYASSKIGDVFEFNAGAAGGLTNPIVTITPPVIDNQYLAILNLIEEKCYNLIGVSQLSAQSKKPTGINSGVALDTLQDVESEKFNSLQMAYTRLQSDLAEVLIDVLPESADVLPKGAFRSNVKWRDIKKERKMFRIQFSDASTLSKDPKTKMEQVEKLIAMKVIDPTLAATLLEFPDLETAYGIQTAAYDENEKTIERAIEDGPENTMDPVTGAVIQRFNYYEITNTAQLYSQACSTLMRLDANDEDPKSLLNLVNLIKQVKGAIDITNQALMPPPPPAPPMPPPLPPAPPPVTINNNGPPMQSAAPIAPPVVQGPTNELPLDLTQ